MFFVCFLPVLLFFSICVFESLRFESNNNQIDKKYNIQAWASWQCFTLVFYSTLSFTTLGQGQSSMRQVHKRRRLQQSSSVPPAGSYSQIFSTQQIHEPIALPAERTRSILICWCEYSSSELLNYELKHMNMMNFQYFLGIL